MTVTQAAAGNGWRAHSDRRRLTVLLAVLALVLVVAAASPAAEATDYTWSGGGSSSSWSEGANWLGGTAPSSGTSLGTLTFPELSSAVRSDNDLSGVSVEQLVANNTNGFGTGGNGFSLGGGGLSLSAESRPPNFSTVLAAPMMLTADQTWNVSGPVALEAPDDVAVTGQLSGESANLTITLNTFTDLTFGNFLENTGPDDEIGNITITGAETRVKQGEGEVIYTSSVGFPGGVNSVDGKRVTVQGIDFGANGPTGPIVAEDSSIGLDGSGIGPVTAHDSGVTIDGEVASLSLDESSGVGFSVVTPGSDLSDTEMTSLGAIVLGDAQLDLGSTYQNTEGTCPAPTVGYVHTLISTTGSLVGSFGNASNGSTMLGECFEVGSERPPRVYLFRINYNTTGSTKTVTATELPGVPTLYPGFPEAEQTPSVSGSTVEGQALTLAHAGWSNSPTGYADQWERCDNVGESCAAIAGATGPTYSLTSADVGSTIRVQEIASNSEGSSSPVVSNATAVVQAAPPAGGSSGSSSTSTSTSTTTSTGSGGGTSTVASISSAEVAASLGTQLVPSGKAATIRSLLKDDGLTMSFRAPEAGTLVVQWYEVPVGAKLAKHSKAVPVLVALGQMTFAGAETGKVKVRLTAVGKRLLSHSKRLKLEAKGVFTPKDGAAVSSVTPLVVR
jgi:hypothetical protein